MSRRDGDGDVSRRELATVAFLLSSSRVSTLSHGRRTRQKQTKKAGDRWGSLAIGFDQGWSNKILTPVSPAISGTSHAKNTRASQGGY